MRKRIYAYLCLTGTAVTLVASVLIYLSFYGFFTDRVKAELRTEAIILAHNIETVENEPLYLGTLGEKLENDLRATLILPDGTVVYDSSADPARMENHASRPEFIDALSKGSGEAVRRSTTQGRDAYYFALQLENGSVLRVSRETRSVTSLFMNLIPIIIGIILLLIFESVAISSILTKKLVAPFEEALKAPGDIGAGEPFYEELEPFFSRIREQNETIGDYIKKLEAQKENIETITSRMSEGLVLLDSSHMILSVNRSAITLLGGRDGRYIGKSLMTLTRDLEINRAVEAALLREESATLTLHLSGRFCRLFISPAPAGGTASGVIVLIVNVTEQVKAERIRRDFTANVSHELKTPLTSITGFAEMIESQMAKDPEDITRFASRIHAEATRLLSLINDIIRLSEIEEKGLKAEPEAVNLLETSRDLASSLDLLAKERSVGVSVSGQNVIMNTDRRMISEMIYNLISNAIFYNKTGGTVEVFIFEQNNSAQISVKDTGIGIPREFQDRVFERFFRVDKGRSRASGGTGLGLSIVKHTVEKMGGFIKLQSKEGIGTEITVTLPLSQN